MTQQTINSSAHQESDKFHGMSPMPYQDKLDIIKNDYTPKIHRIGIPFSLLHAFLLLVPGLFLVVVHNVWPGWPVILSGVVPVWAALAVIYIIEPLQYYLALGTVGTYISSIAGNNSNIRLPTAVATQEIMGVEPGSPEAEIVGGIAVIASQWLMAVLILVGALTISWVIQILPPSITKSFDFLIPALFGGLLVNIGLHQWRYMVVAVVTGLIMYFIGVPSVFITILLVIFMIFLSYFFYKKGIWMPKQIVSAAVDDD